ncbi:MAG TPA: iron-containing redox enzyme family protein [Jatrophihabitans sp.]|jgi:hypothetical protein|uniref:iron-containing redox enzyme family protein n=1 Tax=Jatrophihabitans sp. TaxID=1932789 RepID=UPI002F1AD813
MTTWSLASYRKPFLQVAEVQTDPSGEILLCAAEETFELGPPDGVSQQAMARLLSSMRDPEHEVWLELRKPSPWSKLVESLDVFGLIAEADDQLSAVAAAETDRYLELAAQARRWLDELSELAPAPMADRLATVLGSTLAHAHSLLIELASELGLSGLPAAGGAARIRPATDFYGHLVDQLLTHWRYTAPAAVLLTCLALREADPAGGDGELALRLLAELAGGPYDLAETATQLSCLVVTLGRAAGPGNDRLLELSAADTATGPCSGTNLALAGERLAVRGLRVLGPSSYHRTLGSGAPSDGDRPDRLALGTYLEQYLITRRFVEIILPLLAKRLRPELRDSLFRYYAEEVGHEVFELQTCLALGLTESEVVLATALPAWVTYLDVFARIAATDPVGFLASVMVTEGLPGTRTPVNDLLEQAGALAGTDAAQVMRQHEEVNVELDHTTMARRLLAQVPVVSPAGQRRAMDHLLFLLELNFRAWEELHWYYTDAANDRLHGPFGVTPRQLLGHLHAQQSATGG